jgi:hypothetical protein
LTLEKSPFKRAFLDVGLIKQTYEVLRKHSLQENFDIAACGGRLLLSKQVVSLK